MCAGGEKPDFLRQYSFAKFDPKSTERDDTEDTALPCPDLAFIAAVARSRGDILVTHNTRDFINIPGLQLEDWLI